MVAALNGHSAWAWGGPWDSSPQSLCDKPADPGKAGPRGGDRLGWRGQWLPLGKSWLRKKPEGELAGHCLPVWPVGWHPPATWGVWEWKTRASKLESRSPWGLDQNCSSRRQKEQWAPCGKPATGPKTAFTQASWNSWLPAPGRAPKSAPRSSLMVWESARASATPVPGNDSLAGGRSS